MMLIASSASSKPHFTQLMPPGTLSRTWFTSKRRITVLANVCGRPEWAIATANAPSMAYESAICAPLAKPV
jgi:hypothetical protein